MSKSFLYIFMRHEEDGGPGLKPFLRGVKILKNIK